jgi:hypothetical protein
MFSNLKPLPSYSDPHHRAAAPSGVGHLAGWAACITLLLMSIAPQVYAQTNLAPLFLSINGQAACPLIKTATCWRLARPTR